MPERLLRVFTLILIFHSILHAKDAGQSARFQLPITKIRGLVQSTDNVLELTEQLRRNGRGPAFAIETLAQAYEKRYPNTIGKLRIPAKLILEDPVGHYIDWHEHLAFADKLKWSTPDGKTAPEIRAVLEEKRDVSLAQVARQLLYRDKDRRTFISLREPNSKVSKALISALDNFLDLAVKLEQEHHNGKINKDLISLRGKLSKARKLFIDAIKVARYKKGQSQTLDWFEKEVYDTEWDSSNKDRITLLEFLTGHIENHLILPNYDMNELQDGLHELRRKERIVSILLGNSLGKAVLDETRIKGFDDIKLDAAVASSPYAKLSDLVDRFPVFFPRTTHLQFTRIIEQMGDAKDMGEAMYEWLLDAIRQTGYTDGSVSTPEALAENLVKTHEKYVDPIPTAHKLYNSVRGSALFNKTHRHLKAQQTWSKSACLNHLRAVREGLK